MIPARLLLLLPDDFVEAATAAASPGRLEYTIPADRLEFTIIEERLEYTIPKSPHDFTV